jgi:hypothetical protein
MNGYCVINSSTLSKIVVDKGLRQSQSVSAAMTLLPTQPISYTLSRNPPNVAVDTTAMHHRRRGQTTLGPHNADDQNFNLFLHAKADTTITVTFSGGSLRRTRIEIVDAQVPPVSSSASLSSSSSVEDTRAAKRPKIVPCCDDLFCGDHFDGASKNLSDDRAVPQEHQESGAGRNPSLVAEQETVTNRPMDPCENPSQGTPSKRPSEPSGAINNALTEELNVPVVPLGQSQADAVAADKLTVYLGNGLYLCPGNRAYWQLVRSKQSEYQNSDAMKREQILLDAMMLFNFEQDGAPICPKRIRT